MTNAVFMKIHLRLWLIGLSFAPAAAHAADPFLVENGESRAEIIIAESPARSTRLAAAELQTYVAKISGAQLPIETKPSADVAVQIYVGESPHAAKLGVNVDGLEHGAYRIVSGENWLALIGDDTDFVPAEPWTKNNGGRRKLQPRWEEASGLPYGVPNGGCSARTISSNWAWRCTTTMTCTTLCRQAIDLNPTLHQTAWARPMFLCCRTWKRRI